MGLKTTTCWEGSRGLVRARLESAIVRASIVSSTLGAEDLEAREIRGGDESGDDEWSEAVELGF